MNIPATFEKLTARIVTGVGTTPGLTGLVLLGSASEEGAARRDEWSDHDFFVLTGPGLGASLRDELGWLPDSERVTMMAREGEIGFVVVYDDGHVLEFAYADAAELSGALVGEASVAIDDEAGSARQLVAEARARAVAGDILDPANDVRLVLVKLLLGVGRVRRGERLVGGQFIRTWAVQHLVRAIRGRFAGALPSSRDLIDPLRRFEHDFPDWAAEIAAALAADEELAARALFELVRRVLEPDWEEFPSRAADAVAGRLGYTAG